MPELWTIAVEVIVDRSLISHLLHLRGVLAVAFRELGWAWQRLPLRPGWPEVHLGLCLRLGQGLWLFVEV